MKQNISILSTKKLTQNQCDLFAKNNITIEYYDAISLTKLPIQFPTTIENVICTSKYTAQQLIEQEVIIINVFCVGSKTASLFKEKAYNVVEIAKNASILAKKIVKNHKNESFLFYCGNKRRVELPNILLENQIDFSEQICYNTDLIPKKFENNFDGILFFSPSAVQSFVIENNLLELPVFCIGKTTATEVKKHTQNVIVSEETTVENVISKAINYFRP